MRQFIRQVIFALSILIIPSISSSQTPDEVVRTIRSYMDIINNNRGNPRKCNPANDSLIAYIQATLPKVPELLLRQYDTVYYGMDVGTSADRKFRIWSWDDGSAWMSGQIMIFIAFAEFQTPQGIKVQRLTWGDTTYDGWELGCGKLCNPIYSVQTLDNKMYYLPVFIYNADWGRASRDIEAFRIDGNSLDVRTKIFKTKNKKLIGAIPINFNCGRGWEKHNFRVLDDGRTLLVPIIDRDENMTSKDLKYEFDGNQYIYKGINK
jgi:hypothetical protein